MRNTRLFTACLCVALGWGVAGCEASDYDAVDTAAMREAVEAVVRSAEMPSLEELTGVIESFYRCALGREVAQVRAVSEPVKYERMPFPEQYFRVREESSGRVATVSVYLPSGIIASYGLESSYPEDMEREEPITGEQAFEIAKPVLEWYGLPLNISDYYVDEYATRSPLRLWSIRRPMSYNGVPVRARWIDIRVSMHFAEVDMVLNSPPIIPPERDGIAVTRAEALQKAMAWFGKLRDIRKRGDTYEFGADLDSIEKVITPALNIPFRYVEQPEEKGYSPDKLYYAWSVPVTIFVDEREVDWFVYVDTETGEIITSGRKKDASRL